MHITPIVGIGTRRRLLYPRTSWAAVAAAVLLSACASEEMSAPSAAVTTGAVPAVAQPAAPPAAPTVAGPTGTSPAVISPAPASYTVKPGDTLHTIARQFKLNATQLQAANGIADPRKLRPGMILKVPDATGGPVVLPRPAAQTGASPPASNLETGAISSGSLHTAAPQDQVLPKRERIAAAPATGGKLLWPVQGKVIAGFGPRPDGSRNDGVNLAVPQGTDVRAAQAGVVAYAGSELKEYGNLILIDHVGGLVTAYAHNEQLLVRQGDKIERGQVVAKAGGTGTVTQPQVHFQLRRGTVPIDPTPFMEKL